jgi:hypothetical protein
LSSNSAVSTRGRLAEVAPRPEINDLTVCWRADAKAQREPILARASNASKSALGRLDEARQMFVDLLGRRNAFGLLSEDIHPETGALWGNIPQTYSMAAIIDSAMRLSVKWEHAWRRV